MRRVRCVLTCSLFVLALASARCSMPWPGAARDVAGTSIVSYNAHNLFDDVDSGDEYPEYSIGAGKWSPEKYRTRLSLLADAVRSVVPEGSGGPDILCLVEIENGKVLADLAAGPLSKAGYVAYAVAGPAGTAIHCGLLSRFPVGYAKSHAVADAWGWGPGRDILEAGLELDDGSQLVVFVCHWKSRKEGPEATEAARRAAAGLVASRIHDLLSQDPGAQVIVCGDFNESPDEFGRNGGKYRTAFMPDDTASGRVAESVPGASDSILVTYIAGRARLDAAGPVLFSPWETSGGYSYVHEGSKERLDGFLLGPGLCDGGGFDFSGFSAGDSPFLFDSGGGPVAWNGASGYSDHVPIVLRLSGSRPGK